MDQSASFGAMTSGVISFLGAPHVPVDQIAAHGARVAFLGFPYESANAAIERPGSSNGPRGLRIASNMTFPWSFEWDIDLMDTYRLVDCGDAPLAVGNTLRTHELVEREIRTILEAGAIPVTIGGDHSLAIPGALALSRFLGHDARMGYLQIDAHLDAGETVQGERQTNCSGLARASELPNVDVANMAIIGIRGTINVREWWDTVRDRGITVYPMRTVRERGVAEVVQEALDRVWNDVDGVYVTFDTDSIDAAYAPGTTGPEPGGFTSDEIIAIGRMIGERGLTAVDNVELCPVYDPAGVTARLVWSVITEMLYAHAKSHL